MTKDTLAEKAMEFMVGKIAEDARKLADLYSSLQRPLEAVPAAEPAGDEGA